LGTAGQNSWGFDVFQLLQQAQRPTELLTAPFTEDEAKYAVLSMNRSSAPGPDGFGPSFYRAAWGTIKPQILDLLHNFYQGNVQLERINRSYMVLLPKKPGAVAVDAFRPICLQNCSVKIIAKILTQRLQREISGMIDTNQTGFLKGRSISESFIFAAELVQCCHKRKVPALAIKLDFAKAFDTVHWEGLQTILEARGFNDIWQGWIRDILQSSKSAVLVNGCPGPWITCRRGLRQGDPLSPYLFLLVAETLQQLIKSHQDTISHPLSDELPCPVLQYADDTLIVVRGELDAVANLRHLLDMFAQATGLKINYNKSTAVPIHMTEDQIQQCISALGCKRDGFPQAYLGLPLSIHKLPASAFNL
jgi:mannosylglycoprotein endo-beta-mannosidase